LADAAAGSALPECAAAARAKRCCSGSAGDTSWLARQHTATGSIWQRQSWYAHSTAAELHSARLKMTCAPFIDIEGSAECMPTPGRARARNEPLARSYVTGDATTRAAADAAWTAQHQYGGALLGEHLGQVLVHRLVGHPVRDHRAHSGPAPLARRHHPAAPRTPGPPAARTRNPADRGRAPALNTASPRGHHPNRMPLTPGRR
jgi:hypothetical protein